MDPTLAEAENTADFGDFLERKDEHFGTSQLASFPLPPDPPHRDEREADGIGVRQNDLLEHAAPTRPKTDGRGSWWHKISREEILAHVTMTRVPKGTPHASPAHSVAEAPSPVRWR